MMYLRALCASKLGGDRQDPVKEQPEHEPKKEEAREQTVDVERHVANITSGHPRIVRA